jgi:hypothetical protein
MSFSMTSAAVLPTIPQADIWQPNYATKVNEKLDNSHAGDPMPAGLVPISNFDTFSSEAFCRIIGRWCAYDATK